MFLKKISRQIYDAEKGFYNLCKNKSLLKDQEALKNLKNCINLFSAYRATF